MDIAHFTIYKIYNLQQQVEHWNGTIVMTTIDRLLSFNWHLHQMIISPQCWRGGASSIKNI